MEKTLCCVICAFIAAAVYIVIPTGYTITIEDDPDPVWGDIALFHDNIYVDSPVFVGQPTNISIEVFQLGITYAKTWHYNDYAEYDFYSDSLMTLDIRIRIRSRLDPTGTNVYLDGTKIAAFNSMPGNDIITIHDVSMDAGMHTVRILQATDTPPQGDGLWIDWLDIGDFHVEGELYDRSGHVDVIDPWNITAKFFDDNVLVTEVGMIGSHWNRIWEPTFPPVIYFIPNNGSAFTSVHWTPSTPGEHVIRIELGSRGGKDSNLSNNFVNKTIQVLDGTVEADIDIDPDTLNGRARGTWITCYVELPDGYDVREIDASTILLEDTISPVLDERYGFAISTSSHIVDHDGDGILERMVKFNRQEVADILPRGIHILKVTGELKDGMVFTGYSDEIRVVLHKDNWINGLELEFTQRI